MAQVQCQVEIPKTGDESAPLTVGRPFVLHCKTDATGDWPVLKTDQLEIRLDEADKYKIKLLKFDYTSKTEANLVVTSYKPGEHHLKAVQLVDPDQSVVLGNLDFTVTSLIDPKEPPAEPYGPTGPFSLYLPLWYSLIVGIVILSITGYFAWRWRLRAEKKRLLADMRLNESAQDPQFQFYHVLRHLQRHFGFFSGHPAAAGEVSNYVRQINEAYKIYLARKFQVPTLHWSERRVLADIKKNHKNIYGEFRLSLRKNLAELSRALAVGDQLNERDCQQLLDILRKQVDQIESFQKRGHP